jgi:hypothetical protein
MSLFIGKRDWALRGLMLAVTVGWTSVKVLMVIDTLRNFD